jgi:hypothetical protein
VASDDDRRDLVRQMLGGESSTLRVAGDEQIKEIAMRTLASITTALGNNSLDQSDPAVRKRRTSGAERGS